MNERIIGKVISVNSFRIVVQLEDDLKSMYKSGFSDIYEIARINSYLIIPIGADRIVAIVTQVRIQDETEIEKSSGFITLPKAHRYLVATMIGSIENGKEYKQGVYNYPILDNPVWYVVKDDLDKIFDTATHSPIDYSKDYFLPIGTSPAFSDYKIRINPDKFFGKHAAVLGNTGSGKSCTVASILQSLFAYDYDGKQLESAHFIIFDTNGEYKRAFVGDTGQNIYQDKALVNTFYIENEGLQVPFWFMNFDDFDFLFEPSAQTQTPIFKRSIALAKSEVKAIASSELPASIVSWISSLIDFCEGNVDDFWKIDNYDINTNASYVKSLNINGYNTKDLVDKLLKIQALKPTSFKKVNLQLLDLSIKDLKEEFQKYNSIIIANRTNQERNIDLPIQFQFRNLIDKSFEDAIKEQDTGGNRLRENVSTLKLRLHSYYNDERIAKPLLLNQTIPISNGLTKFLAFILGDFMKIYDPAETDQFTKYYENHLNNNHSEQLNGQKCSQISIIDMSLLPFEVLETITGLIARLILEFQSRFSAADRGKMPTVIVLEEAQNYIPEQNRKDKASISKRVFERIAREGRKYGISLVVSSQRPSELSKTVLSQCNSFIVHRLQNPEDQKYVRQLVSAANEDILQQLPILPQQNAIIMGDCVRTPVQMKVNNANPTPNSENPKFIENWLKPIDKSFPDYKSLSSAWETGISIDELLEAKQKSTVKLSSNNTEVNATVTATELPGVNNTQVIPSSPDAISKG
jgi:uncharacterized protein